MPSFQASTVLALLSSAFVASAAVLPSPINVALLRRQTNTIAGLSIPALCQAGCDSSLPIYNACTSGDTAGCLSVCNAGNLDALTSCANCIYFNIDRSLVTEQSHDTVEDQLDNIDDLCDALSTTDEDDNNDNVDFIDWDNVGQNYTASSASATGSTSAAVAQTSATAAGTTSATGAGAAATSAAAAATSSVAAAIPTGSTGAGIRTTSSVGGAVGLVGLVSVVAMFV
ncbi:hypothetical protein BDY24DRAFT_234546 [Mrakia frigida]|uniref:uncharacterized protein n=1 Tax=Mrakia frigida TaxID=29902 RepID=UPI003FCBFC9C